MQKKRTCILVEAVSIAALSVLTTMVAAQQPAGDAALSSTSVSPLLGSSASKGSEVTIGAWYFLGPYADGNGSRGVSGDAHLGGLDYDYLATSGRPEARIDSDALRALCRSSDNCTKYASSGPIINLLKQFPGRPHSVLYAAAVLDSDADGYVGLQYDISFGAKIWMNGEPVDVYRASTRHPVSMYIHFAPLHVKKGANVLLIKTNQEDFGAVFEPWGLVTSIMPITRMWNFVGSNQDGFLLAKRLLKPGDSIHIPLLDAPMMLDRSAPTAVSVSRRVGEPLLRKTIARDDSGYITLPALEPGYYKVRLDAGSHVIDDAFYIGDTNAVYEQLKAVQDKAPAGSDEFLQRDGIIKRYEVLTSKQYSNPGDSNWQKKLMFDIEDAEASMADQSDWYMRPGQHFRELSASTDHSQLNYLLDIPETVTEKMGLVIVAPYAVQKQRPFLESAFISYSVVLEQIRQAANENKLAVAIIGARESSGESAADEADALDVLKDIESHYSIDSKRLYLYGVCEGGRNALLLAEHHPGIFAAVGAWGPTLAAARDENYDPVLQAKQIANTPLVLFKGDLDNELPNSALQAFGRILKSLGNQQVTIQIVPNAMHDPIRMESVIFPLLARFTKDEPPGSTGLSAKADVSAN